MLRRGRRGRRAQPSSETMAKVPFHADIPVFTTSMPGFCRPVGRLPLTYAS